MRKHIEVKKKPRLSRGQNLLIRVARRLVESRLKDAGFEPVKGQNMEIKEWENLALFIGNRTSAEKELTESLELIADLIVGRPILKMSDLEDILNADALADAGAIGEMEEVIKQLNSPYTTGVIRNIGLWQPGYDPTKRFEEMRRDPAFHRLLKATSKKRVHVVLFGKLYSFGEKKDDRTGNYPPMPKPIPPPPKPPPAPYA